MLRNKRTISTTWLGLMLLTGTLSGCGPAEPLLPTWPVGSLTQAEGLGKDGELTVSAAATVVNRYAVLATDARRGDTTLSLSKVLGQGVDALLPLAPDDLLLVVQLQGADLDTSNTASYGAITDLRSAGLYEFIGVSAVDPAANQLTVYSGCGGLKNSYQASGHVQVIRVPQYVNLTVASGASIVAPAWNGSTGGIVALQIRDTVTIDGDVDVSGLGFRGGQRNVNAALRLSGVGSFYRTMNALDGGNRGEGIGGYQTDYAVSGQYGRGAAANGGGGGNRVSAGGGGGGGSGDIANWNGQGVMPMTVAGGAQAWLLDPGYDVNKSSFSGGGRGGYTYSGAVLDPTVVAPADQTWSEDFRRERGGLGGRPLANDPRSRLFLGGGGGSGDDYQGQSGIGGNGGGLVFIDARKVTGSGQVAASGQPGGTAGTTSSGAGGGGGGGTIVIATSATLEGVTLKASGADGGEQQGSVSTAGGPGGGGGGGFIGTPTGMTVTPVVDPGLGGSTKSKTMVSFPRNGATDGAPGQVSTAVAGPYGGAPYCSVADLSLTMTATPMQAAELQPFKLDLTATNLGPGVSGNAVVRLDRPDGVAIANINGQGWSCQPSKQRLTCTLVNFPNGAAPPLSVTITPALGATSMTFTSTLSAPTTDLDMSNNTASVTLENPTPLVARPAGGGFSCSLPRTPTGASPSSGGLWLLGLVTAALGLSRQRNRAS